MLQILMGLNILYRQCYNIDLTIICCLRFTRQLADIIEETNHLHPMKSMFTLRLRCFDPEVLEGVTKIRREEKSDIIGWDMYFES